MRPHLRATAAALGAGAVLGLFAGSGCSAQDCKSMKASGNAFAGLFCGGAGDEAPEPVVPALSLCQPREVMPVFFSLIDHNDPSFAGLRDAMADLGRPVCLIPTDRSCTNDDQCAVGHCSSGLCPCQTSYSPLTDVLGITLRAMTAIAKDPVEAPGLSAPGCLTPAQAKDLPADKRSRICELRRMLDILLANNGGSNLINDANIRKVLLSLLDYVQGKTDPNGTSHYDLLTPIGRMAGSHTASCDPAALWTLLDNMLGYLDPAKATAQLGGLQILLADPQTKQLLAQLAGSNTGASGRDGMIVLLHSMTPGITNPANDAAAALKPINDLLKQLVYGSSSYSQAFQDEVRKVIGVDPNTNQCPASGAASQGGICEMLSAATQTWVPLQNILRCAASPEVRCADPANCPKNQDELVGALYDILSKPEAQGGVDLATLVGALKSLTTLDQTGQTGRTLRLVVQGIEGSSDPNDAHEARDAVASLASSALTAQEGQKLVPAISVLIEKQVVGEFISLLHDLLYTCSPPPATH
jgi:hypothetical protein